MKQGVKARNEGSKGARKKRRWLRKEINEN